MVFISLFFFYFFFLHLKYLQKLRAENDLYLDFEPSLIKRWLYLHVFAVCWVDGGGVAVPPQYDDGGQHIERGIKLQNENRNTDFIFSSQHLCFPTAVLDSVVLVKWQVYSRLTANPKAEALCRMMETAGKKTEREKCSNEQQVTSKQPALSVCVHWYLC